MTEQQGRRVTGQNLLCVGSYTDALGTGTGITIFAVDPATGALSLRSTYPVQSPSYLQAHPWLPVIYALTEAAQGVVSTFAIAADGMLTLSATCSSGGAAPCHAVVTPDGTHLIVSNYNGGSVAVLPLDEDGNACEPSAVTSRQGCGPDPDRQEAPHPHLAANTAAGTFLLADLGTDEIVRYEVGGMGPLAASEVVAMAPGTGPRQVVVVPGTGADGSQLEQLVVVGELSSDLTLLGRGMPTPTLEWARMPAQGPGHPPTPRNYPAHIEVAPGGRVLYVSNRGADCVTSFLLEDSRLRFVDRVQVGAWPRHLSIFGQFLYVAAEHGHAIDLIRADHTTGALQHVGQVAQVNSPTCVLPITVSHEGAVSE